MQTGSNRVAQRAFRAGAAGHCGTFCRMNAGTISGSAAVSAAAGRSRGATVRARPAGAQRHRPRAPARTADRAARRAKHAAIVRFARCRTMHAELFALIQFHSTQPVPGRAGASHRQDVTMIQFEPKLITLDC
jgi:hypothetical protein